MDEAVLAAKMKEMAEADMKYVKSSGSFGDNPNFGSFVELFVGSISK